MFTRNSSCNCYVIPRCDRVKPRRDKSLLSREKAKASVISMNDAVLKKGVEVNHIKPKNAFNGFWLASSNDEASFWRKKNQKFSQVNRFHSWATAMNCAPITICVKKDCCFFSLMNFAVNNYGGKWFHSFFFNRRSWLYIWHFISIFGATKWQKFGFSHASK